MHFHVRIALRSSVRRSFYQPVSRCINRTVYQSVNQSKHCQHVRTFHSQQSVNQSTNQSINESTNESINQSVNRSVKLARLTDVPAPLRSHYCNQLYDQSLTQSINPSVSLAGFVESVRLIGDLFFAVLRDSTGSVQLVWTSEDAISQSINQPTSQSTSRSIDQFNGLQDLTIESFVAIKGVLRQRPDQSIKQSISQSINQSLYHPTNNPTLEVSISSLYMLSHAATGLPVNLQSSSHDETKQSINQSAKKSNKQSSPTKSINQSISQFKESEEIRFQNRFLDLRRPFYQSILRIRNDLSFAIREHLYRRNYTEVETPLLFKSTPEGAREFLVPTRLLNNQSISENQQSINQSVNQSISQSTNQSINQSNSLFYALPQSPQQFKQVLMSAGVEKYYQFARCFRDEGQRADRQPEFTQLDLEFACHTETQIRREMEDTVKHALNTVLNRSNNQSVGQSVNSESNQSINQSVSLSVYQCDDQFQEMKFVDAVNQYGVDKPDIRYDLKIQQVSISESITHSNNQANNQPIVKFIRLPGLNGALSRKELDAFQADHPTIGFIRIPSISQSTNQSVNQSINQSAADWKMPAKLKQQLIDINQFDAFVAQSNAQPSDLLLVSIGSNTHSLTQSLGRARIAGSMIMSEKRLIDCLTSQQMKFLWVVDFPLFDMDLSIHYNNQSVNQSINQSNNQTNNQSNDPCYTLEQVGLAAMHHPFTAPREDDLTKFQSIMQEIEQHAINQSINQSNNQSVNQSNSLRDVLLPFSLLSRLSLIRGQHYDLVCNGVELGGGSVRIHQSINQRSVFRLLGADARLFSALLRALDAGCPPHGGLAIGFDRFVATVSAYIHPTHDGQAWPIRDVIAFPKTTKGNDLLFQAPSTVTHQQLQEYHIKG